MTRAPTIEPAQIGARPIGGTGRGTQMRLLFTTRGRISRQLWWGGVGTLFVYHLVAILLLIDIYGSVPPPSLEGRAALFLVSLAGIAMASCLSIKRFHDRGRPAAFALIPMAVMAVKAVLDLLQVTGVAGAFTGLDYAFFAAQTAIGLWFVVELGVLRGAAGDNRYGPDPLATAADGAAGTARS